MDEAMVHRALLRHWEFEGIDYDISHEIYHEDAILEFPQSGERFVGKQRFQEWRSRYPARLQFKIRRITGGGDHWVTENLISYDGGPWMFTISVLLFRGDKVAREFLYVLDGFEAAKWREPWATRFDPLASISPSDWREGVPFGLEAEAELRSEAIVKH